MKKGSLQIVALLLSFWCAAQPAKTLRLLKAGKFDEAISLTKEKKDKYKNSIKYHLFLARGYVQMGNDLEAEKEYEKALDSINSKERKLQLMDFDVVDELALLRVRTGNWVGAQELINWSLATRKRGWNNKNPTNFRPYLPLGILHLTKEEIDSAKHYLKSYTKNLRNSNYTGHLDVDKYADAYQSLAEIALDEGDLVTARRYANKSSRLQRHEWTRMEVGRNYPDRVVAYNTLTTINLKENRLSKARRSDRKATYLLEKHLQGHDLLQAEVYLNKAKLAFQNSQLDSAKTLLRQVMKLKVNYVKTGYAFLSEYEKQNTYQEFERNNSEILQLFYQILAEQEVNESDPLIGAVYDFVINTKAVILNQSNKLLSSADGTENDLKQELDTWKDLKRQWYYLNTTAKKKSGEKITQVQSQIVELEKSLSSKLKITPAKSWQQIKKNLKEDELAVEFIEVKTDEQVSRFLAFKITNRSTSPELIPIEPSMTGSEFSSYYHNSIKFNQTETLTYKDFWEPLKISSEFKSVYVSPSGALHKINFSTLRKTDKIFVSDVHELINISNTGNLSQKRSSASQFSSATLVGISDFGNTTQTLNNLPGVATEIEKIDELLKEKDIQRSTIMEAEATEGNVKILPSPSIFHLATHGTFDSNTNNPMLSSGLILHPDKQEDGLLTAYEASLLDLENTELVVLSACASGLGDIVSGEGVYGLQRAFEVAGVKNIIMAMWNIDDDFTQFFMTTFYEKLLETNNVSEAFSMAQQVAKKQDPNPRLWGAFKLLQFF